MATDTKAATAMTTTATAKDTATDMATATTKAADASRKMPWRPYLGRQATHGREPPPRIYHCCCVGVGQGVHRRGVSKVELTKNTTIK